MSLYINPNVEIREAVEFGIGIPPKQFNQNDVYQSDWMNIKELHRVVGIGEVQDLADASTLHVYFRQADDNSGTNEEDVTGSEVTVTADGEQDAMAVSEITAEELDRQYVALHVYHDDVANPNGCGIVGEEPTKRDGSVVSSETGSHTETTETA